MSKKSRRRGSCAFCGRFGQMTREDFTPKWLGRLLDEHLRTGTNWELASISFGGDREYQERSQIVGGASAIKPAVVCELCNSGWMSQLEKETQPILGPMVLGRSAQLDGAALRVLATWATKTALVFELVHENQKTDDTTASAADRDWFRRHCRPLPTSRVWIGRYVGSFGAQYLARSTLLTYLLDDPSSVPEPHGLLVTLAYGEVAVRVALIRTLSARPTRFAVTDSPHTPLLWPTSKPMDWPLETALNDDGLVAYGTVHLPSDEPGALAAYGSPPQG